MRCRQGVGIRLRRVGFVVFSLTLLLGLSATTAAAEQCPAPLVFPCFTAKPIIDGNATPLYKGQYKGNLYGHWNSGFPHSTDETYLGNGAHLHDDEGVTRAATTIKALCRSGSPTVCDPGETPKIVVVALGFSNWTKEVCGDQFSQPLAPSNGNYQADPSGYWLGPPPMTPMAANLPCDPNAWSFSNYSQLNNNVLQFVDCAIIGAVAKWWKDDSHADGIQYPPPLGLYTNCTNILYASNLDPKQVQIVLFKDADSDRSEGNGDNGLIELPASGFTGCNNANRRITCNKTYQQANCDANGGFFPNTKMMFVHSRIYGGYANPDIFGDQDQKLNPEPFAYESGLAMKWLIQSQIDEMQADPNIHPLAAAGSLEYSTPPPSHPHAPWIDWGPYMWAGMNYDTNPQHPRLYPSPCHKCEIPDLTWRQDERGPNNPCPGGEECNFEDQDNTHPGQCGRFKVAWMLKHFYCGKSANSKKEYTQWFWGATQGNVASCQTQEDPKPLDNGCDGRFGQGPE